MWVMMKRSGVPLSQEEKGQDHLRITTCLFDAMARLGSAACQTSPDASPIFTEQGIRAVADQAASKRDMDASTVARTLATTYRAWQGQCRVLKKYAWHFTYFLNNCELSGKGDLEVLCVRNDQYPKWAPRYDHPIGPLGRGDQHGGMRELPIEFADLPAASIDLSNNFELDPQSLRNLPADLLALNLSNVELGAGRNLPSDFAGRCPGLVSVDLTYNPHGWREALQCLPPTVRWLDLSNCGVSALPCELGRWFPALESLTLGGNPNVLNHPLPYVPSLRRLDLFCCDGMDGLTRHEVDSGIRKDECLYLAPLPDDLGTKFPRLEEINVGGNKNFSVQQIVHLPESVVRVNLPSQPEEFPAARADGKPFAITQLSFDWHRISVAQLMSLPPSLERMDGYLFAPPEERMPEALDGSCRQEDGWSKERDVDGNMWCVRTGPREVPPGFTERFTRLKHFRVGGYQSGSGVPIFAINSLVRLPSSLRSLAIPNKALREVPAIFDSHLARVEVVDIGGNPIDPSTLSRLPPALRSLDCSGGPNRGDCFPGEFYIPEDFGTRCPALEELRIYHHHQLNVGSFRHLPKTLTRLALPSCAGYNCDFHDDVLLWFPRLEELDLAGSLFTVSATLKQQASVRGIRLRLP